MTIQPYLKSTQILVCPSDSTSLARDMSAVPGYSSSARRSYAIPVNMSNIAISTINAPALTVMCAERDASAGVLWSDYGTCSYLGRRQSRADGINNPYRHLGTTTTLYADGHVKSKKGG